jgi:signal transduction histidine kinase
VSSVYYGAYPPVRTRQGASSKVLNAYLDRWEARIAQRIENGPWQLEESASPRLVWQRVSEAGYTAVHFLILERRRVGGVLSLVFSPDCPPSDRHRACIPSFLQAVGGAVSLISELALSRQRISQLSLFYQLAQATASTVDLDRILDDTVELVAAMLDASASALLLVDEEARELVVAHAHGEMVELLDRRTALEKGIAGWVATHGEPVLTDDARCHSRYSPDTDSFLGPASQSVVAVPVRLRGQVIAVLQACSKRTGAGFDTEDLSIMLTTANQTAAAIRNSQFYEDLRAEQDRIIQAQENVRRQVARNLHDGTVQFLAAISMSLDHLEQLLEIKPEAARSELHSLRDLARQANQQARLALFELRPLVLETQGLAPALEMYVRQLQDSESFAVHLQMPTALPQLTSAVSATLFSIIQEAVTNAKKHASPDDVWLRLFLDDGWLCVIVEDNGKGFDCTAIEQGYDMRGSIGVLSMKERADLIDGHLEIRSTTTAPHTGTEVILRVPLPRDQVPPPD